MTFFILGSRLLYSDVIKSSTYVITSSSYVYEYMSVIFSSKYTHSKLLHRILVGDLCIVMYGVGLSIQKADLLVLESEDSRVYTHTLINIYSTG